MSSVAVSPLQDRQGHRKLPTDAAAMAELTDEDLAQVTGADGWERMEHMRKGCHRLDRRIRLHLTHLRIEWRFDWLNYNLRVN